MGRGTKALIRQCAECNRTWDTQAITDVSIKSLLLGLKGVFGRGGRKNVKARGDGRPQGTGFLNIAQQKKCMSSELWQYANNMHSSIPDRIP